MTRHIILWTLKEMPEAEKARVRAEIKAGLEGLAGQIPGLVSIRVETRRLPSSNADLMLDSSFESPAALAAYATHPGPRRRCRRQGPPLHGRAQLSRL